MTPLHHAFAIDNGEGEFCIPMKVHAIGAIFPEKGMGTDARIGNPANMENRRKKYFFELITK